MTTYAIGDIQGCYKELRQLLELINFSSDKDQLWFVGDLVNRGPDSLSVLRFIKALEDNAISVLGNHDLHMLGVLYGIEKQRNKDTFDDIISAKDRDSLIEWICFRPLIHVDENNKNLLVHAGIYPSWNLKEAQKYAKEVESVLQGNERIPFLKSMYGDKPDCWSPTLSGWDRLRFITNSFTRMRYCTEDLKLEMKHKGPPHSQPAELTPWYLLRNSELRKYRILMGHWSTLNNIEDPQLITLDTGCLWGGKLTAYSLESPSSYTSLTCSAAMNPHG